MSRWTHEWDVVGEPGKGRFVESDAAGVPANRKLYKRLREAESRGELAYKGLVHSEDDASHGGVLDGPGRAARSERSYADDSTDGASVSGLSIAGDMALYRDN